MTCPKLTVSRTGLRAANRQAASAKVNQRLQPARRASGSTSRRSTNADAATVSARLITIVGYQARRVIGSMQTAANGG
ncbi:hypothetical protein GA0070621_2649 [Micromonospora narathiwatensis]|uniref:Uncharacterized protein n=1 Tax=Micromonospora narathiwatensis TaxID=299146 RepID=A0A1A8ZRV0_9ACTN|nr:hypothetical protein GA0070621_2649 [Micromonospora narathiwatensis]